MRNVNRCPRCRGNLLFTREDGNREWRCLQCGRSFSPSPAPSLRLTPVVACEVMCLECNAVIIDVTHARRRYCSDRCRMRAARRRWAGRGDQQLAV